MRVCMLRGAAGSGCLLCTLLVIEEEQVGKRRRWGQDDRSTPMQWKWSALNSVEPGRTDGRTDGRGNTMEKKEGRPYSTAPGRLFRLSPIKGATTAVSPSSFLPFYFVSNKSTAYGVS